MKTLAKTTLSVASLSLLLAFSAGAMADDKKAKHKHYGDRHFNGYYDDRYDRHDDYDYDDDDDFFDDSYNYRRSYRHDNYGRVVRARVTDVEPVYNSYRSQPIAYEECYRDSRHYSRSDRRTGSVLGAVIGGVIGYNTGGKHRHNRRSGAAVGAVLGSVIGGEAAKGKHRSRRHCETVYTRGYDQRELVGYNVEYKYKGQRFDTFMRHRPGRYINVRLTAEPVGR